MVREIAIGQRGKPSMSDETSLPLSALGGVTVVGEKLRLQDGDGGLLLALQLDSLEQVQAWISGLRQVLTAAEAEGSAPASAPTGTEALARELRALLGEQEDRIKELEAINTQKEQQLLKLHSRLEEALMVLQAGQRMYSEQQQVLEAQQAFIAQLQQAAAAGAGGEADEEDDEDEEEAASEGQPMDEAAEVALLARQAQLLQAQLMALTAAAGAQMPSRPVPASQAPVQVRPADAEALAASPEMLAQLQALLEEKDRLEEQLRTEQAELEQQLERLMRETADAVGEDGEEAGEEDEEAPEVEEAQEEEGQQHEDGSDSGDNESDPAPDDRDEAAEVEALARRARDLQLQLQALGMATSGAMAEESQRQSPQGMPSPQVASVMAQASQAMAGAPELLAHLQALIDEKDRLEEQLRNEQAELEQQLQELLRQGGGPNSPGPRRLNGT